MGAKRSFSQEYCLFRQGVDQSLAEVAAEKPVSVSCRDDSNRMCGLVATIEGLPDGKEFPVAQTIGECAYKLTNGYAAENLQVWPGKGIIASSDL